MIEATEEQEQKALIKWASYQKFYPYLFAVPNGGYRHKATAGKLKAQGVKPGVSDLMLALPSKGRAGLFLEMKRRGQKGRLTKEQERFLKQQKEVGYETNVAYGWEQGMNIIKEYLGEDANGKR